MTTRIAETVWNAGIQVFYRTSFSWLWPTNSGSVIAVKDLGEGNYEVSSTYDTLRDATDIKMFPLKLKTSNDPALVGWKITIIISGHKAGNFLLTKTQQKLDVNFDVAETSGNLKIYTKEDGVWASTSGTYGPDGNKFSSEQKILGPPPPFV